MVGENAANGEASHMENIPVHHILNGVLNVIRILLLLL